MDKTLNSSIGQQYTASATHQAWCVIVQLTNYREVLVDDGTPSSVGCSAGVVPTVAPLHRGDGEDVVCHCDSVTTSDR